MYWEPYSGRWPAAAILDHYTQSFIRSAGYWQQLRRGHFKSNIYGIRASFNVLLVLTYLSYMPTCAAFQCSNKDDAKFRKEGITFHK